MAAKPFENSKKTAVILRLFESRWNGVQLERPMVNLQEVKEAIEALGNEGLSKALSSRNPANFFKDFIRRADSANKNWPTKLKGLRWTAEQRTGENNCFEFVRYSADQTEPFEESFGPSATTPVHRMQSITIPKASRDLGRKDEQWLIQVAVQQGLIPTHLALQSSHKIDEIVHLQSSVKLRKTEIDALFLAQMVRDGKYRSVLITCEAKHGESILPDQIVSLAYADSASKKSDWIIPMAIKVIRDASRRAARAGGQVYVCEFEGFEAGNFIGREDLKVVSECLYEFQPPIPGV
jgi:hypothetical protein